MDRLGRIFSGQRESTVTSKLTEVILPLLHTKWGVVALLSCTITTQWFTSLVYQEIDLIMPEASSALSFLWKWQFITGIFLSLTCPVWSLGVAFIINIWDPRWPPTHAQQPAGDGPNTPFILRWLLGFWNRGKETEPVYNVLDGQEPVVIPEPAPIDVTIRVQRKTDGGQQTTIHQPKLTTPQWNAVHRLVRQEETISYRHLRKVGGLSNNSAREVGKQLVEQRILPPGNGKKPTPQWFVNWVMERGYKRNIPMPHPDNSVTPSETV